MNNVHLTSFIIIISLHIAFGLCTPFLSLSVFLRMQSKCRHETQCTFAIFRIIAWRQHAQRICGCGAYVMLAQSERGASDYRNSHRRLGCIQSSVSDTETEFSIYLHRMSSVYLFEYEVVQHFFSTIFRFSYIVRSNPERMPYCVAPHQRLPDEIKSTN